MDKDLRDIFLEKYSKGTLKASELLELENLLNHDNALLEMIKNENFLLKSIKNWGKNKLLARLDVIHEEVKKELNLESQQKNAEEINNAAQQYSLEELLAMFKMPELETVRSAVAIPSTFEETINIQFPNKNFELEKFMVCILEKMYHIDLEVSITDFDNNEVYSRVIKANSKAFILNIDEFENALPGRYNLSIVPQDWRFVTKYKSFKSSFIIEANLNPYE